MRYPAPAVAVRDALLTRQGEYYAVNQILSKQLHNADDECLAYTTGLMDRLEKVRRDDCGVRAGLTRADENGARGG